MQTIIDLFWGDRPDDAPAVWLPWCEVVNSERAQRLPKRSAACFLAFLKGEPTWDDHGRLPIYERAEFYSIEGAARCRQLMVALRKRLNGTVPAVIDFDYEEVVS